MIVQALALTLRLAVVVSLILLLISLPLAYWLTFSRWRGKFLAEALVSLPIVLAAHGAGILRSGSTWPAEPHWPLVSVAHRTRLAFTFTGLVIGSVIYSLPFSVQPMAASFASVDRKLLEASAILGASRWRTFWRIVLPLSFPGVLTGFVLSFAHTLGEFGVVLMIGGNIPGATQTVSILIYDQVQALNYRVANETAGLLLVLCLLLLTCLYALRRHNGWILWDGR